MAFSSRFASFSIIFSLIFFSKHITFDGNSSWTLVIHGDRVVRGTVSYNTETHKVTIISDNRKDSVPDPASNVYELFEMYKWIFEGSIERVNLSRKITSIAAKNFYEIIQNSHSISQSIYANWEFYQNKSIDKFINFKQNFTDYMFNHNQELIKFHTKLSSDMSDTAFKMLGYLLVFLLGWQEKANKSQFELYYIVLGLFFLCIYLLFSLKRFNEFGETYIYLNEQHKKHLKYYKELIDIHDFEEDRREENKKFIEKYKFYLSLLCIFLLSISLLILYFVRNAFLELSLGWVIVIIAAIGAVFFLIFGYFLKGELDKLNSGKKPSENQAQISPTEKIHQNTST